MCVLKLAILLPPPSKEFAELEYSSARNTLLHVFLELFIEVNKAEK